MKIDRLPVLVFVSSLALGSGWVHAQTAPSSPSKPSAGQGDGVAFTTGGVGLDARQEMASQTGRYNLHLEFAATPSGEYVSGVEVSVVDSRGTSVLSTRTDGPWLLARLPAGTYTVTSRLGDVVQKQQIGVGEGKRHMVVRFPASAGPIAGGGDR